MLHKLQEEAYKAALEYTAKMFEMWLDINATAKIDPTVAAEWIYWFFEEDFMKELLKNVEDDDSSLSLDFPFAW